MNSTQARESRRKAIEGIQTALRTISADGSYLRSIESCEAVATAWQCVGRLQAINEQESYSESLANGRPVRSPRPSIIPGAGNGLDSEGKPLQSMSRGKPVTRLTPDMEAEAAFRLAWEASMMTADPNELDDMVLDESHEYIVANGKES